MWGWNLSTLTVEESLEKNSLESNGCVVQKWTRDLES
jgi:hypothetical protein